MSQIVLGSNRGKITRASPERQAKNKASRPKSFKERASEQGLTKREAASKRVAEAKGNTSKAEAITKVGQERLSSQTNVEPSTSASVEGINDPLQVTIFGAKTQAQQTAAELTAKRVGSSLITSFSKAARKQKESRRNAQVRAVFAATETRAEPIKTPGTFTKIKEKIYDTENLSVAQAITSRKEQVAANVIVAASIGQQADGTFILAPGSEGVVNLFVEDARKSREATNKIIEGGREARLSKVVTPYEQQIAKGVRTLIPVPPKSIKDFSKTDTSELSSIPKKLSDIRIGIQEGADQLAAGYARSIVEKPYTFTIKVGAYSALAYGLPSLAAGVAKGVSSTTNVLKSVPTINKAFQVSKTIGLTENIAGAFKGAQVLGSVGLPTYFVAKKVEQIRLAPSGEKAFTTGKILAGDITPLLLGAITGAGLRSVTEKAVGYVRTRGLKEVRAEDIIPERTLEGKQTYPLAPTRTHKRLFTESAAGKKLGYEDPRVFHASSQPLPRELPETVIIKESESEIAGLFNAPFVSPQFLRVTNGEKIKFFGLKIFEPSPIGKPTVSLIKPTGIEVSPVRILNKNPLKAEFITPKPGVSQIPLVKTEVEALLAPGTILKETGNNFFFSYKGQRIPIEEFTAVPAQAVGTSAGTLGSASYYSVPSSPSVINPSFFSIFDIDTVQSISSSSTTKSKPSLSYSVGSSSSVSNFSSFSISSPSSKSSSSSTSLRSFIEPRSRSGGSSSPPSSPIPSIPRSPSSPFRPTLPTSRTTPSRTTTFIPTSTPYTPFNFDINIKGSQPKISKVFNIRRPRSRYVASLLGIERKAKAPRRKIKKKRLTGLEFRPLAIGI